MTFGVNMRLLSGRRTFQGPLQRPEVQPYGAMQLTGEPFYGVPGVRFKGLF